MCKTIPQLEIERAVEQLCQSARGRSAIQHVLAWLDDDGLALDGTNQKAITFLISRAFELPMSTRDAMRAATQKAPWEA